MKLNELVERSHNLAKSKGWWDSQEFNIPEKLALIHSEVSEALEAYRVGDMEVEFIDGQKPDGFPIELADAVIRIFDLCGRMGIDLEAAIELKHAYNEGRPQRHGGKRA